MRDIWIGRLQAEWTLYDLEPGIHGMESRIQDSLGFPSARNMDNFVLRWTRTLCLFGVCIKSVWLCIAGFQFGQIQFINFSIYSF